MELIETLDKAVKYTNWLLEKTKIGLSKAYLKRMTELLSGIKNKLEEGRLVSVEEDLAEKAREIFK